MVNLWVRVGVLFFFNKVDISIMKVERSGKEKRRWNRVNIY